jgi:NAD/NADP transhydrogenase alpha subunit
MDAAATISGFAAIYIVMLAAFTGIELITKVPVILHTPLMSGSNFIHGVVVVGAMVALGHASTPLEQVIGLLPSSWVRVTPSVVTSSPSACLRCSKRREISDEPAY